MANPTVATPDNVASDCTGGFVPVWISTLRLMGGLENDLYILNEGSAEPVLFRKREYAVDDEELLAPLIARGVKRLYVKTADYSAYQQKLDENLDEIIAREDIEVAERCSILQAAVSGRVEHAFRLIHSDSAVKQSHKIGKQIADLLPGSETLPGDLFSMVRHDTYTFTHLTNVASYCVLLAEYLGITDQEELKQIAVGGLLHDLGKRLIPKTILNKPSKLSEDEFRIIQAHAKVGYEELHDRTDLCHGQLMMIYQHHEKMNGTGYPVRIMGEEIHPWARLCAVVDVFDAMTCTRPYRKRMPLAEVIEHLQNVAGAHLDKEMVACWTSAMSDR